MFETICLGVALVFGSVARVLSLPPLVGFLAAGFFVSVFADDLSLPASTQGTLKHISHLGVLLLLFSVGLKVKLRQIIEPAVIGTSLGHFALSSVIFAPIIHFGFEQPWFNAALFAFALSFSSTVLAAKILEVKKELRIFHGRNSIGILIVQDIIAMLILAFAVGQKPNIYAAGLLLLPALRWGLHRLVSFTGHGEMLIVVSMFIAIVVGGGGFSAMGLSSELGALVMGVLLNNHPRSSEITQSLGALKELFLVGFFLHIGMSGVPTLNDFIFAATFSLLLPIKAVLFLFLLTRFRLRARTAFHSSLTLTSHSEFGLIMLAAVLPEFLTPIALTVALSFVISAPLNRCAHAIFATVQGYLGRFQSENLHPDDQPTSLGDAEILVFGMGRTGLAAYRFLEGEGLKVVGLDADNYLTAKHQAAGRNVFFADAEDSQFWDDIDLSGLKAAIFAMDDIEAKLISARRMKSAGFKGPVISHALHEDHQQRILEAGATHTYLTMTQAGIGLGESAILAIGAHTNQKAIPALKTGS